MNMRLGYVSLGVLDLAAWRTFSTDFLAAEVEDGHGSDTAYVRIDEHGFRYLLRETGENDVREVGWELPDRPALAALRQRLDDHEVPHKVGGFDAEMRLRPRENVVFDDPDGLRCVAYIAPSMPRRTVSLHRGHRGFVTGSQGAGHLVLGCRSMDSSLPFYLDVLGFRVSDYILVDDSVGGVPVTFLHCNERHHTLALFEGAASPRLNHVMFQCESIDDVGAALDIAQESGVPIVQKLGRHSNDEMLSFYVETPSGFEVEYGWGGRTIDDSTWSESSYAFVSTWGHQRRDADSVTRTA